MTRTRRYPPGEFPRGIYTSRKSKHKGKVYPPGLNDRWLEKLWRRAVLKHCGYRCVICGAGGELECHHIIHRGQSKRLRFDVRNGVPVCPGECHEMANWRGIGIAGEDAKDLVLIAQKTFKQYLAEEGLSEAEWRGRVKAALLAELANEETMA